MEPLILPPVNGRSTGSLTGSHSRLANAGLDPVSLFPVCFTIQNQSLRLDLVICLDLSKNSAFGQNPLSLSVVSISIPSPRRCT